MNAIMYISNRYSISQPDWIKSVLYIWPSYLEHSVVLIYSSVLDCALQILSTSNPLYSNTFHALTVYLWPISLPTRSYYYCISLLTKTFCLLDRIVQFLYHLIITLVWREIQPIETRVRPWQPCVFANLLNAKPLWTIAPCKKCQFNILIEVLCAVKLFPIYTVTVQKAFFLKIKD